ncbi:pilus assembly protein PilP [Aromatoleum bremense]|uniref:Pilus assembly protein PilP n=1 Tax=Aromatoleum bremense TaxID=76115 RepID=A0ABX1NSV4_9RHOO|nr:pilus assembly protein PilP [Aromatoleum bremense]NMG15085.1 pilus assembly protein PilP [Aromatoleum bremense]QTQ31453.1 Type IV fimbrial biogenesis protein [Aromatoleum bremense]
MKRLLILACAAVLAACSSDQEDIRSWMTEQEKGMRSSVKPLPEVRPFPVVEYTVADRTPPFAPERLEPETKNGPGSGPDLNRRREPLEAFPLESLELVGVMRQGERVHALVRVDKSLYQVRVGNYMGQNFGVVSGISDAELTLKELVEDLDGDWVERTSKLLLQERQEAKR